jgi:hypothetical protein
MLPGRVLADAVRAVLSTGSDISTLYTAEALVEAGEPVAVGPRTAGSLLSHPP